MAADRPTILATSGGITRGARTDLAFAPLIDHAFELSGVTGRRPRMCHVGTASGDQRWWNAWLDEAAQVAGVDLVHLNLFTMPPVDDIGALIREQDVVWVGGGSVANLLAVWAVHDLGPTLADAWRAGVVLGGVSAGSICWHVGGTTDSFGPDLRAVTNGLALVPYSNGVHYDSEEQRRPFFQECIATGVLPAGYATDDGVGLVYQDTTMVEAVSESAGKAAYWVSRVGGRGDRGAYRAAPAPRSALNRSVRGGDYRRNSQLSTTRSAMASAKTASTEPQLRCCLRSEPVVDPDVPSEINSRP